MRGAQKLSKGDVPEKWGDVSKIQALLFGPSTIPVVQSHLVVLKSSIWLDHIAFRYHDCFLRNSKRLYLTSDETPSSDVFFVRVNCFVSLSPLANLQLLPMCCCDLRHILQGWQC